jgi:hypothetical protein
MSRSARLSKGRCNAKANYKQNAISYLRELKPYLAEFGLPLAAPFCGSLLVSGRYEHKI